MEIVEILVKKVKNRTTETAESSLEAESNFSRCQALDFARNSLTKPRNAKGDVEALTLRQLSIISHVFVLSHANSSFPDRASLSRLSFFASF